MMTGSCVSRCCVCTAPRVKWCDSKDFWDSETCERRMLETDWARCLQCGIGRYIERMDDSKDMDDEDGADEVDEVFEVLWEYHDLFYAIFDFYAILGASDDLTHMQMNSFGQFVNDCHLVDNKSQFCKSAAFDQLFISVDASSAGGKTDEKHNRKKALNRQEFLQCMVKIACMRYVQPGDIVDVSDAVHQLFAIDLEPNMDERVFVEPNEFRDKFEYCEEVDLVLRRHEANLRLVYERACKLRGQSAAKGLANKLISFEEWRDLCRLFELIDVDLTERDITLAFVWSRMRVVDEQSDRGRLMLTHLSCARDRAERQL